MLNINKNIASLDFNFLTNQLKEIISTENAGVILSRTDEFYDSDEVINIDEVRMEKLNFLPIETLGL